MLLIVTRFISYFHIIVKLDQRLFLQEKKSPKSHTINIIDTITITHFMYL